MLCRLYVVECCHRIFGSQADKAAQSFTSLMQARSTADYDDWSTDAAPIPLVRRERSEEARLLRSGKADAKLLRAARFGDGSAPAAEWIGSIILTRYSCRCDGL